MAEPRCWTIDELRRELQLFEQELEGADLALNSIRTYVDRSAIFLRWLTDDYAPRGPSRRFR